MTFHCHATPFNNVAVLDDRGVPIAAGLGRHDAYKRLAMRARGRERAEWIAEAQRAAHPDDEQVVGSSPCTASFAAALQNAQGRGASMPPWTYDRRGFLLQDEYAVHEVPIRWTGSSKTLTLLVGANAGPVAAMRMTSRRWSGTINLPGCVTRRGEASFESMRKEIETVVCDWFRRSQMAV